MQSVVKQRCCGEDDVYRLAYSRPGLVTFKGAYPVSAWSTDVPRDPFVRASGHVLAKISGTDLEQMLEQFLEETSELDWMVLHVWQVDADVPGRHGFEPGPTPLVETVVAGVQQKLHENQDARAANVNTSHTRLGDKIVDLVIERPDQWWIGTHVATERHDCWPGGVPILQLPISMISRAYLKIAEAVAWADLPVIPNQKVVEIGSAPGGSCQYFLDCGLSVTGIDPAEMDPEIMKHPKFTHVRSRAISLKRRFFAPFHHLACDANVAPNYTIDTVGDILMHESNRIRNVVLTLKCKDAQSALDLPNYLERIKEWGFRETQVRQLAYNRTEITVLLRR